jgi:DNA-directed RNA polymerase specialized sigma24 family protein
VTITAREALDRVERPGRKKRGGGREPVGSPPAVGAPDADGAGPEQDVSREPTPESAAMVADECRRLLAACDDETLRRVALLRIEGCSDAEIAARADRGPRAVGRKLE